MQWCRWKYHTIFPTKRQKEVFSSGKAKINIIGWPINGWAPHWLWADLKVSKKIFRTSQPKWRQDQPHFGIKTSALGGNIWDMFRTRRSHTVAEHPLSCPAAIPSMQSFSQKIAFARFKHFCTSHINRFKKIKIKTYKKYWKLGMFKFLRNSDKQAPILDGPVDSALSQRLR